MAAAAQSTLNPRPGPPSPPELSDSALAPSAAPAAAAQLPLPPPAAASIASRRLSPPCWGHEETLALIDAYREKWYELRRGNLRASHWQEVADALRRRRQRLAAAPAGPKTAVQCRHKVEKLRQRYRAEKQRLALRGNASKPRSSSWAFFPKMDAMEVGNSSGDGAPSPLAAAGPSLSSDDGNDGHDNNGGNPKKVHMLQLGFSGVGGERAGGGSGLLSAGLEFRIPKALRSKVSGPNAAAAKPKPRNGFSKGFSGTPRPSAVGETGEERVHERKKGALVWELVEAVKTLGDEFTRVEEMKMEMARDMEKLRREMELKRTELILHSQRQIVDYIRGLHEKKRANLAPKS